MNPIERYLAATSGKNKNKKDIEDLSAAGSHEAVHDHRLETSDRSSINNLGTTSHAVIHKPSRESLMSSVSKMGGSEFASCDMSIYDEVTVMEEEILEEVIEEEEEEVVEEEEEEDDYAWGGSKPSGSERSRLSQRFPKKSYRQSMDGGQSVRSSDMYEEETVFTTSTSMYEEQTVAETVTEEQTVIDGDLDDYKEGDDEKSHDSELDSDDGVPEEENDDEEEEEEENEGGGFTLAFKRNSASQARVSDITLDHTAWAHEMDGEFDDDEHHIPGQGEEGYCSQFKEGNFRSSLVSNAPSFPATAPRKSRNFGTPSTNSFLPSNKFSAAPKTTAFGTSSFVPKNIASTTPPRVSIMKQFANKPLPAVTEASARKERGEKKIKKPSKSFDGAGQKKELFLFWERKSSGGDEMPTADEESKTASDPVA